MSLTRADLALCLFCWRQGRERTHQSTTNVEERVIDRRRAYFADTYNNAPLAALATLCALARGEHPALDERTRRFLQRRCLITPDDGLRIPALGARLRHEGLA